MEMFPVRNKEEYMNYKNLTINIFQFALYLIAAWELNKTIGLLGAGIAFAGYLYFISLQIKE
jgi:hypothetical protein